MTAFLTADDVDGIVFRATVVQLIAPIIYLEDRKLSEILISVKPLRRAEPLFKASCIEIGAKDIAEQDQ